MGASHSTYTTQAPLDVPDRESGGGSPDVSMIEPVPEGLEHVVYPKYEEAFRLGLEAFNNPMRVNKFYRPLPHILGSTEFQKHSHAGIVPVPKMAGRAEMSTPYESSSARRRSSRLPSGSHGHQTREPAIGEEESESRRKKRTRSSERVTDWTTLKQSVTLEFTATHHSYADLEATHDVTSKRSSDDVSVASEADLEGFLRPDDLEQSASTQMLQGGLFDADEDMSTALQDYRQKHRPSTSKTKESALSSSRSQLTRMSNERTQVSKDLEQLGKSISDLQQRRAVVNK